MTIWVTGAKGMLGRLVAEKLGALGLDWIGTDLELDIAEREAVSRWVTAHRPQALINCAAYTAVDAAETDEARALRVNGLGPTVLAETAREAGATFVHVSTDYVLDGEQVGEQPEDAPLLPCNAYGRTKLVGERGVLQAFSGCPAQSRWYVVRTSWLFGSGPSSFVETMWNLLQTKPKLRVVADQRGRPTYAGDLADFLVSLARGDEPRPLASGLWHFANAEPTTWYEFAGEIRATLLELGVTVATEEIEAVTTAEFPRPARRPKNSVLSTCRLEAEGIVPRSWRAALREYAQLRMGR